jgi:hypothetical protein
MYDVNEFEKPDISPNPAMALADLEGASVRLAMIHDRESNLVKEIGDKTVAVMKIGRQLRDAEVELERCQQFHVEIIKVLDDISRAVASSIAATDPGPFAQGLHLIRDNFLSALRAVGIERMEVKPGCHFDPRVHEAIGTDASVPRGIIAGVATHGYQYTSGIFAGRLVRPAKVGVGEKDLEPIAVAQGA